MKVGDARVHAEREDSIVLIVQWMVIAIAEEMDEDNPHH